MACDALDMLSPDAQQFGLQFILLGLFDYERDPLMFYDSFSISTLLMLSSWFTDEGTFKIQVTFSTESKASLLLCSFLQNNMSYEGHPSCACLPRLCSDIDFMGSCEIVLLPSNSMYRTSLITDRDNPLQAESLL